VDRRGDVKLEVDIKGGNSLMNIDISTNTKTIKPSRQFVTGGAGFIGSHLVDRLLAEGNSVTVYDNLVSGSRENLKQHLGDKNFRFFEADLSDFSTLKKTIEGHEVVWHFAANAEAREGIDNTDLDLRIGTITTYNVLEAMRLNNIRKMVFSSSGTVFGETLPLPIAENYGPLLPISLYGASKLAGEGLITAFCHIFDMQAWIFRFANIVGSKATHGVVYDFIKKLRANPKELQILGDGTQEKPYLLVEDCIEGIFCAFHKSASQYNIFHLGCDTTSTVRTIAHTVVKEMGLNDVEFQYTGGSRGWRGDVAVFHFDSSKMAKLGWSAKHTSDEAIRLAVRRLLGKEK
jgi:UDP-glucose 4-epimerase